MDIVKPDARQWPCQDPAVPLLVGLFFVSPSPVLILIAIMAAFLALMSHEVHLRLGETPGHAP